MKKIVMQLLADSLELSRVTVWKVLNGHSGVSEKTVQRVMEAVEKLNRADPPAETSFNAEDIGKESCKIRNITLVASRASTSVFWMRIVDQIASELNLRHMALNYIPVDVMQLSVSDMLAMITPDKTDGVIVINVYDEEMLQALTKCDLPKVFFDTIPGYTTETLNGDLLLLEGERTISTITAHFAKQGMKKIGFIGDVNYALTNKFRYDGYKRGLAENNIPYDGVFCLTSHIELNGYKTAISDFLSDLKSLPDAFICINDYVAFLVIGILDNEFGIKGDVALAGYDDSSDFLLEHYGVTTVHVKNGMLGKRMINQIVYRIENPTADFEEVCVVPKIIYRGDLSHE